MITKDRVFGMFLGIGIGDALYVPVEIFSKEKIASRFGRITDYIAPPLDHKWFAGREAGLWSDDTELSLLLADSLAECGRIDMDDIARRHIKIWESVGDIGFGGSTVSGIKNLIAGQHWSVSGFTDYPKRGSGNGLPMKLDAVAAAICSTAQQERESVSNNVTRDITNLTLMTHDSKMAVQSALAHVAAVRFCLLSRPHSFDKDFFVMQTFYAAALADKGKVQTTDNLLERLAELSNPNLDWGPDAISERYGRGSCYVYNSLPFSYAFFLRNPTSIETLYDVGNAGGDTDTNASIVGGMLGALNGTAIFPKHLIEGLKQKDRLLQTAERFCEKFEISD